MSRNVPGLINSQRSEHSFDIGNSHMTEQSHYTCVLDCLEVPVFKAKNELYRHIQYKHKLSVEKARTLAATYPTQEEVNFGFVDPRENLPP